MTTPAAATDAFDVEVMASFLDEWALIYFHGRPLDPLEDGARSADVEHGDV